MLKGSGWFHGLREEVPRVVVKLTDVQGPPPLTGDLDEEVETSVFPVHQVVSEVDLHVKVGPGLRALLYRL